MYIIEVAAFGTLFKDFILIALHCAEYVLDYLAIIY